MKKRLRGISRALPVHRGFFGALIVLHAVSLSAQPFETTLTNTSWAENFDSLGVLANATLPSGWVFAQGLGSPRYGMPADCQLPPHQFLAAPPTNCLNCARDYDGGTSGGTGNTATPTGGARVNYSDINGTDRAAGFMSLNSTGSGDYRAPTNHLLFGFTNSMGSNITALAVTNNIKMFRDNVIWSSGSNPHVEFFYSYDGTNWTHLAAGDIGPFAYNSATTYYFNSGPIVSNASFNITGLNIPNGSPFYLDWMFVIANASGSFSFGLALDDVGLTATLGAPSVIPASVWPGGSGNWSVAANWQGSTLPASGNRLIFSGPGGNMNHDLAALATGAGTIRSLTYSNIASASYVLSGNPITLTEGITNNSSFLQTINNPLTLGANLVAGAYSGALTLSGNITNSGFTLTIDGVANSTLNGIVQGAGGLAKSGGGTLTLNSANTYAGNTTINAGILRLGASERIPDASPVTVDGTLDLNGFGETLDSVAGSGAVALGGGTLTVNKATGSATFSGAISGNGNLIKNGAGAENLTGANNYHGTTTVNAGILQIGPSATFGDGTGTINWAGGAITCGGTRDTTNGIIPNPINMTADTTIQNTTSATAGTRNFSFGSASISATTGTLTIRNMTAGNFTNIMNLRLHGAGFTFSRPIAFDNSTAANSSNNTCQLDCFSSNGTPAQIFAGVISGPGRVRRGALIPGDAGTTILAGNNTYSLGTTLDRGYLGFGINSTSSAGVVTSGPIGTGTLTINDDMQIGIFASGGPRAIENDIVLNAVTNTGIIGTNDLTLAGTFNVGGATVANKTLTVDNTGITTISGPITNVANLTKAGAGLLILTGDNLWSGGLSVANGTVLVNNVTGSGTGNGNVTVSAPGVLGGTGTIAGNVSGDGNISPGQSAGNLTIGGGLDLSSGGTLVWELAANNTNGPGTNFDLVSLTGGNLVLGGSSKISISFIGTGTAPDPTNSFWQSGHTWKVVSLGGSAANPGSTRFASIINGNSSAGSFTNFADGAGNVILGFNPGASLTKPFITSIRYQGTNVVINFTGSASDNPANFSVITAAAINGTFTNATGVVVTGSGGLFQATAPASGNVRFYRIGR